MLSFNLFINQCILINKISTHSFVLIQPNIFSLLLQYNFRTQIPRANTRVCSHPPPLPKKIIIIKKSITSVHLQRNATCFYIFIATAQSVQTELNKQCHRPVLLEIRLVTIGSHVSTIHRSIHMLMEPLCQKFDNSIIGFNEESRESLILQLKRNKSRKTKQRRRKRTG